MQLSGIGTDPEDGDLPGSSMSWHIVLHHGDHVHDFATQTGATAQFTPVQDHDADSHYEVTLTARDSSGQTSQDSVELFPQTIDLALNSLPPGAPVTYEGDGPNPAPVDRTAAIGFKATIEAPDLIRLPGPLVQLHRLVRRRQREAPDHGPGDRHDADGSLQAHRPAGHDDHRRPGRAGLERLGELRLRLRRPRLQLSSAASTARGFQPCSSPWTGALPDGDHRFGVRATDPYAGTPDPTPAFRTFSIDTTRPGTVRLRRTLPGSPSRRNHFTVLGSAEPGSIVWLYDNAECAGPGALGGKRRGARRSGPPGRSRGQPHDRPARRRGGRSRQPVRLPGGAAPLRGGLPRAEHGADPLAPRADRRPHAHLPLPLG